MEKNLIEKFVFLGQAGMQPAEAMEVAEDFALVESGCSEGNHKYTMAVYRLAEGEGALLWLVGYRTRGMIRRIGNVDFSTVSHLCADDKLDLHVAIYAACKKLGVTRLRSYYPPMIPGITGVLEWRDRLEEQRSYEEFVLQIQELNREEYREKELTFLATLQQRCSEIDGAG